MSFDKVEVRVFSGPDQVQVGSNTEPDLIVMNIGPKGDAGTAATVTVGTTTTGAAGTNASVTNSGTTSAAVLNFTIPQGATGANGGSSTAWRYRAKTNATSGYPTNGHLIWNNATQLSATEILVSHLNDDGSDIELFLSFFVEGQKLFIQNRDDSSQNQIWEITGTPTVTNQNTSTSYYTFPVTLVSSQGAEFNNNHSILFGTITEATNSVTSATTSDGTATLSIADLEVVGGEIYTNGEYSNIYTQGATAHIFTLGSGAEIYTEGELAQIYTTGASAQIYTAGAGATIGTQGANATIYTQGTNATISTAGSAAHIQTSHANAAVKSTNFAAVESGGASLVDGSMQPCLTWSAGGRNLTIPSGTATTFNSTSYTYGTGAAAAHRTALELGDFSTVGNGSDVSVTGAVTLTSSAFGKMHVCTGTSADYTVTLPSPSGNTGRMIAFRMSASLTKFVTLSTPSGAIDGVSTRVMWAQETAILYCDGTNWTKVSGKSRPLMASGENGAGVTVSNATVTPITLATTINDASGAMIETVSSTKVIRIKRAGNYQISSLVTLERSGIFAGFETYNAPLINTLVASIASWATSPSFLSVIPSSFTGTTTYSHISLSGVRRFSLSDYIALGCYQNTGGTMVTRTPSVVRPNMSLIEIPEW